MDNKPAIEIVEWRERYEVSSKGREPGPDDELRAGPLQFIRLKVYGHKQGTGYRRLKSVAGDRTMEVFGIFCKLLEIAGDQKRGKRGILLNERDDPATAEDLAFILDVPAEQVKYAISVLSDKKVNWLVDNNTTQHNSIQLNSSVRKFPGNSGSGKRYKYNATDLELSKLLFTLIQRRRHDHPEPNFEDWANEVRKLREIEKKTPEQIKAVIKWAQADGFWWDKVLSTASLRKKSRTDELKRIERIEITMQKDIENGRARISKTEQTVEGQTGQHRKAARTAISEQDFGELQDPLE